MNKVVELDDKVDNDNLEGDYIVDEKAKTATLTPLGVKKAELVLRRRKPHGPREPDPPPPHQPGHQGPRRHAQRDVDYVVKDGEVIIVDEFTGRLMIGRRYNEGLHQAIEAKEGVEVAAGVQDPGHHHLPELVPHVP